MSDIRKLFTQTSHYLIAQVIIMAAGFISFPILTRVLSVSDYGLLGLISLTVFIVQALARLGSSNAIVRFYADYRSTNSLDVFYSTVLLGFGFLALIVSVLFLILVRLFFVRFIDPNICNLLTLVTLLIFLNSLSSIITSTFRAEQKSALYNCILILQRYGGFVTGLLFFFYFRRDLYGFYSGQILSAMVLCLVLLVFFIRVCKVRLRRFSPFLFKAAVQFGFPLTWSELGHLALSYSDRYLIQCFLGPVQLGIYVAAYNLTSYVSDILMYPVNYALDPIYMGIYSKQGQSETGMFLSKALRYFSLFLMPIIFGFIAVGKELIAVLASTKYAEAYVIIPYVILGNAIYACQIFLNAGLCIARKTNILMVVKISACILNIGLNLILIPRFGIIGAAQATIASYICYTLVITHYAFKELAFRIRYGYILLYTFLSFLMFVVISNIHMEGMVMNIICKVAIGGSLYIFLVFLLDKEIRLEAKKVIKKIR